MKPEYEKMLDMMDEVYERGLEMKMDAEHDTDAYGRREPTVENGMDAFDKELKQYLKKRQLIGMRAYLLEYAATLPRESDSRRTDQEVIESFLDWVEATR